MEKRNLYKEIILLLAVFILTGYAVTFYFLTAATAENGSKIPPSAMLIFIGIFVAFDLIILLFLLLNITKDRKTRDQQINTLIQDIDSQNREEMEQRISKAKIDFLVKTCREIRSSLNDIIGFNNLILGKKNLDKEVFENASKIRDSGIDFIEIINDILDFSKIKYGQIESVSAEYEISALIKNILSSNIINTESKPLKFNFDIDAKMPSRLAGNEFMAKQIFNNLLYNAFKYTKSGTIEWNIGFESQNNDIWLISKITDSGMGIEKEQLKGLLSNEEFPFERIDGMELKFAIVKEMAKAMSGDMEIESKYGKGTAVTVKIKQQISSEAPIGEKTANLLKNFNKNKYEGEEKFIYNKMPYANILIVDDMISNLEVARRLMQPYEMNIDVVSNGRIALAKIINQSIKYSAVFIDYMMPEMDGVETLRKIRALDNNYAKNIPVIVLTANTLVDSEKMLLDKGFNDFLGKPIDIVKLDVILKKWVRDENKEIEKLRT